MEKLTDCPELIEHLKGGGASGIHSLLLILGGGMNMFFGWAAVNVLEKMGLRNFTTVIGTSAGALIGSYFVAGQSEVGASMYYEELASRRFVQYLGRNIFDLDYAESLLREGKYRLDGRNILSSSTQLYLTLTRWDDGKGILVKAGTPGVDIVSLIKAAVAPPGIYNDPLYPLGSRERYADGAIAFPFPLQETMRRFSPTHLVVIANNPLTHLPSLPALSERLFLSCLFSVPSLLRKKMVLRYAQFRRAYRGLGRIQTSQVFIFAPERRTHHVLTRNSKGLQSAFCEARQQLLARI